MVDYVPNDVAEGSLTRLLSVMEGLWHEYLILVGQRRDNVLALLTLLHIPMRCVVSA